MNIPDNCSKAFKTAARVSENLLSITKINFSISTNKELMRKLKLEIGEYIYDMYKNGKIVDENIDLMCEKLLDKEKQIEAYEKSKLEIKKIKKCNNCMEEASLDSIYCSKCGYKIGIYLEKKR